MKAKSPGFWPLVFGLLLFTAGISAAQDSAQALYLRKYQNGLQLYNSSRWHEAAAEFRSAQETAANINDWSQATYWVILSQLAYSDYGSAVRDMDDLERTTPNSGYTRDMAYHRGRVYFNLGYFDDALLMFRRYIDSVSDKDIDYADRIAAAFFWMGECLFTMGQFDEAEKFYTWVVDRYPESPKYEISTYRLDLIKQKKIETELLALLQWSHEESLRSSEDYQRRIRTYEHTLNTYQRRIDDIEEQMQAYQEIPPEIEIPGDSPEDNARYSFERLLEWARELNTEVDVMIKERESGGSL